MRSGEGTPPLTGFMDIFKWFYFVMGLILLALAIGNFLSARFMKSGRNRTFSLVVAGINCLQIPLGTVLGVFTIIVLSRDSVSHGYKNRAQSQL